MRLFMLRLAISLLSALLFLLCIFSFVFVLATKLNVKTFGQFELKNMTENIGLVAFSLLCGFFAFKLQKNSY